MGVAMMEEQLEADLQRVATSKGTFIITAEDLQIRRNDLSGKAQEIFSMTDVNKDGVLSLSELEAMLLGNPDLAVHLIPSLLERGDTEQAVRQRVADLFNSADVAKDEEVTPSEWTEFLIRKWHYVPAADKKARREKKAHRDDACVIS